LKKIELRRSSTYVSFLIFLIYPNWDFWFENKPSGNPEFVAAFLESPIPTSGFFTNDALCNEGRRGQEKNRNRFNGHKKKKKRRITDPLFCVFPEFGGKKRSKVDLLQKRALITPHFFVWPLFNLALFFNAKNCAHSNVPL
jgi:hypothetical protein